MSTDWNVKCLDCNTEHHFNGANHQDELMAQLCKHANAIADIAPLLLNSDVTLETLWGQVDAAWFARHKGHTLAPINEYGDLLGQCAERIRCCEYGHVYRCKLASGHTGSCSLAVQP